MQSFWRYLDLDGVPMETVTSGPRVCAPEDVEINPAPWVSGTRAQAYYGPLTVELTFSTMNEFELNLNKALCEIRAAASNGGANYLVGFEMVIDPFGESGIMLKLVGTAAHLVPLFE